MQYYFAPLEGITDAAFRRLHHKYFPGVHRYYTPFFSPTVHRCLTPREQRELPPANSLPYTVIPQVLAKEPEDFLWMAGQCRDLGYSEVNLNLGCPSGTVTAKGKGAGMLRDTEKLDCFLDAVFHRSPLPISIKTRIGFESPEEFPAILEVFSRYPVKELTIHPRVRSAFYKGQVHMDVFRDAVHTCAIPLCYNGDIGAREDVAKLQEQFPGLSAVMVGRGLLADPGMFTPGGTTAAALACFYEALLECYQVLFGSARNAMFRLKENWGFLLPRFAGSEKLGKALRKTTDLEQYKQIAHEIFHTLPYCNSSE